MLERTEKLGVLERNKKLGVRKQESLKGMRNQGQEIYGLHERTEKVGVV